MSTTEERFRSSLGEKHLKNGRIRCQGSSKTKIKQLRIKYQDPTLKADDLWPECQCSWAAVDGLYACELHGGKSPNALKKSVADWLPYDLKSKLDILESNKDALFNRDNEIAQLLSRNAQLYESMDELVLGEEAYQTVAEAKKALVSGDVGIAISLLDIALSDTKTEKEIMVEMRENIKLIDKLTITQFNIRKELKIMATVDQVRNLLEGIYRGFEKIASTYISDDRVRGKAVFEFAGLIRDLANARHSSGLTDGT